MIFLNLYIPNLHIHVIQIRYTLWHKFVPTDMIFFDQFIVPTVKFGKYFAEFMIPIALLKELGGKEFSTTMEVTNMRRCCGNEIYKHNKRVTERHRHQAISKPKSSRLSFEPRHEKTNILHMRKQRRRSASRSPRS